MAGVAEVRAVGESELGELRVAHRTSEQVEVTSNVGGAHVARDLLPIIQAPRGQSAVLLEERPFLTPLVRKIGCALKKAPNCPLS